MLIFLNFYLKYILAKLFRASEFTWPLTVHHTWSTLCGSFKSTWCWKCDSAKIAEWRIQSFPQWLMKKTNELGPMELALRSNNLIYFKIYFNFCVLRNCKNIFIIWTHSCFNNLWMKSNYFTTFLPFRNVNFCNFIIIVLIFAFYSYNTFFTTLSFKNKLNESNRTFN